MRNDVSSNVINWRISARVSRASRTSHRKKRPAEIVCENEQKAKRRGKTTYTYHIAKHELELWYNHNGYNQLSLKEVLRSIAYVIKIKI